MDCREYQKIIDECVLDPAMAAQEDFRQHRESCPKCASDFELAGRLYNLESDPEFQLPWDKMENFIMKELQSQSAERVGDLPGYSRMGWMSAAAAVLIFCTGMAAYFFIDRLAAGSGQELAAAGGEFEVLSASALMHDYPRVTRAQGLLSNLDLTPGTFFQLRGDEQISGQLTPETGFSLSGNSRLQIGRLEADDVYMNLEYGDIYLEVDKNKKYRRFTIQAPDRSYTVKGTRFQVRTFEENGRIRSELKVFEGAVALSQTGEKASWKTVVTAGHKTVLKKNMAVSTVLSADDNAPETPLLTGPGGHKQESGILKLYLADSLESFIDGKSIGHGSGLIEVSAGSHEMLIKNREGKVVFLKVVEVESGFEKSIRQSRHIAVKEDFILSGRARVSVPALPEREGQAVQSTPSVEPEKDTPFQDIEAALDKKLFSDAIRLLKQLMDTASSPDVREKCVYLLGSVYFDHLHDGKNAGPYFSRYLADYRVKGNWIEEAAFSMAEICLLNGEPSEAVMYLTAALPVFSSYHHRAEALYRLGTIHRQFLKDFETAAGYYSEIVKDLPRAAQYPNALYWYGKCRISAGKISQGNEAYQKYLKDFPDGRWTRQIRKELDS